MVFSKEEISSSSSDSSSDEETDEVLQTALESMKKSLSVNAPSRNTEIESRTAELIRSMHQKIYNSFDSDDDNDSYSPSDVAENREKTEKDIEKELPLNGFVIDKGGSNNTTKDSNELQTEVFTVDLSGLEEEKESQDKAEEPESIVQESKKKPKQFRGLSSTLMAEIDVDDIYVNPDPADEQKHGKKDKKDPKKQQRKMEEPEIMKKCVLTEDYEKQVTIPTEKSRRAEKRERRIEREKTKGSKWFDMPAQEVTAERKNDFLVYQMRKSLDPKRFYKTNDAVGIPKYYQFGTVVEHATDFYDSRIPKKQRKANMVEELLADVKFRQYNKKRFKEIQEAKRLGTGPYDKMKKLKNKPSTKNRKV